MFLVDGHAFFLHAMVGASETSVAALLHGWGVGDSSSGVAAAALNAKAAGAVNHCYNIELIIQA